MLILAHFIPRLFPINHCSLWWWWWWCSCSVTSNSATPRTAARQASLSFTISQSLFKLISIESVMLSNHLRVTALSSFQNSPSKAKLKRQQNRSGVSRDCQWRNNNSNNYNRAQGKFWKNGHCLYPDCRGGYMSALKEIYQKE